MWNALEVSSVAEHQEEGTSSKEQPRLLTSAVKEAGPS